MLQPWFDLDIVESATAAPIEDVAAETVRRLVSPLGGRRLRDLAADAVRTAPNARAVIAVTDLTRAAMIATAHCLAGCAIDNTFCVPTAVRQCP